MEKTRRSKGLEWCPEADLNHRHADFQSSVIPVLSVPCDEKTVKLAIEDQILSGDLSKPDALLEEAATWLVSHREECTGRIIPTLKQRFGLTICEAISAAQMAHALQYGEVRHG